MTVLVATILISICFAKAKMLKESLPLLGKSYRPNAEKHLRQYYALMGFFIFGYLLAILAFFLHLPFINELFTSMLFLLIAVFIYLKVILETNIFMGLQETLKGLLPICAQCKKICPPNSDPNNPNSWVSIEVYVSEHSDAKFTHGYCPNCFKNAISSVNKGEK